jgi:tetratricopeptide (TPR) repeat protein
VLLEAYSVLSDPDLKARYDTQRTELRATPAHFSLPPGICRPLPAPAARGPAGDGTVTTYGPVDEKDIVAVEKLVARQPNNPDLLGWLAFLYYSSGQVDKAMDCFRKVLALNGKDAKSHYYLGHCYVRKGHRDKAFLEWETVIALDPFGSLGRRALKRVKALRELKR